MHVSSWTGADGHATFLQRACAEGWDEAVDLGQGVSDYIESRGLPEKATAQYIKEVDWLCQVSPRMNEQVWDRVRYIMVWSGIADPI